MKQIKGHPTLNLKIKLAERGSCRCIWNHESQEKLGQIKTPWFSSSCHSEKKTWTIIKALRASTELYFSGIFFCYFIYQTMLFFHCIYIKLSQFTKECAKKNLINGDTTDLLLPLPSYTVLTFSKLFLI